MKTIKVADWTSKGEWVFSGRSQDVYRKLRGWARLGMRFGWCGGLLHDNGHIYAMVSTGNGYEPKHIW